MNHDTPSLALPFLVKDVLADGSHFVDNLLAITWRMLDLNRLLRRASFLKHSGVEVTEAGFVLMLWQWLRVSSVTMFRQATMDLFSRAKKEKAIFPPF